MWWGSKPYRDARDIGILHRAANLSQLPDRGLFLNLSFFESAGVLQGWREIR